MTDTGNTDQLYEVEAYHKDDKIFKYWISYFDTEAEALTQQQYSEYVLGCPTIIKLDKMKLEETIDNNWELSEERFYEDE